MIFCTKNPLPILHRLSEIPFPYLFHVTFTPYHQDIESHVLDKKAILEGIVELSKQIGKDRVYAVSYTHLDVYKRQPLPLLI